MPPESSSHSACQDKETKREVEEHARRGIGDGEPEEPKVKGEDESVEDIDVLQGRQATPWVKMGAGT